MESPSADQHWSTVETMIIAVAVLAVVSLLLLVLLLSTRRTAAQAAEVASAERQRLQQDLTHERDARKRFESLASEAERRANDTAASAASDLATAKQATEQATNRATAAEATVREQSSHITSLEKFAAELQDALGKANSQIETAGTEILRLREELDRASTPAASVSHSSSSGSAADSGIDLELLWALELTRSERTWRHSVALDPNAPSPFADASDPLKLAVEVEAAAMREEVGAFIQLRWEAEPVADPVRRVLILRVANELLMAAARESLPFEMVSTGSDSVTIALRATEEADRPLDIDPPAFGSDVIDFRSDPAGVTVTIA